MHQRSMVVLIASGALAACGGSGAGNLGSSNLPGPPEFNSLLLEAEALADKLDGLSPTDPLPEIDGVEFDGVMIAAESFDDSTEGYLGDFTATVNFASGDMTGEGTGFFFSGIDEAGNATGPGTPVEGTVTVSSTNVSTGLVDFEFGGTLFIDGLERSIVDSTGEGGFAGPDGDMMFAEGDLEFDTTSTTLETVIVAD